MESKRTAAALALAGPALAVVLATGTPLKNARPSNIFPLLRAIGHPVGLLYRSSMRISVQLVSCAEVR